MAKEKIDYEKRFFPMLNQFAEEIGKLTNAGDSEGLICIAECITAIISKATTLLEQQKKMARRSN